MSVFPLSEGTYTVDNSKTFIPFDSAKDQLEDRPASLVVDIVPFLIKLKNELIVIDPGLGFMDSSGEFMIHAAINRHGYSAEDVSMVLLSHLHKDHAKGIAYGNNGAYNLMFPNANIYCQEKEMEYAFSKTGSPSFDFEKLEYLNRSSNLKFVNGSGKLNDEINYEVSGGHTPYHQVFTIHSGKEIFFYGGDVVPQPSQIIRRFVAKYDYDGKLSAQRRAEYSKQGAEDGWTFLFFHDGKIPMAKVVLDQERFRVVKI